MLNDPGGRRTYAEPSVMLLSLFYKLSEHSGLGIFRNYALAVQDLGKDVLPLALINFDQFCHQAACGFFFS